MVLVYLFVLLDFFLSLCTLLRHKHFIHYSQLSRTHRRYNSLFIHYVYEGVRHRTIWRTLVANKLIKNVQNEKKNHFPRDIFTIITNLHVTFVLALLHIRSKSSKSIIYEWNWGFCVNTIYLTDFLCIINLNIFSSVHYNDRLVIFELIAFRDNYPSWYDNFLHFYCIIYTQSWTKKSNA